MPDAPGNTKHEHSQDQQRTRCTSATSSKEVQGHCHNTLANTHFQLMSLTNVNSKTNTSTPDVTHWSLLRWRKLMASAFFSPIVLVGQSMPTKQNQFKNSIVVLPKTYPRKKLKDVKKPCRGKRQGYLFVIFPSFW